MFTHFTLHLCAGRRTRALCTKMERISFIILCVCITLSYCEESHYRASVIQDSSRNVDFNGYLPLIYNAGKSGADIVVLPSTERSNAAISYDEAVKNFAKAARQADLYVVAHLYENTRYQNKNELIRSNLVFNREGNIVSVYRKPVNSVTNCTTTNPEVATFTTDFGVKFGLLMEEDLVLINPGHLKGINNFVVTGEWSSEIPLLGSQQISSSWAFTTNANLISHAGVFAGRGGARSGDAMLLADLNKNGGEDSNTPPVINPSGLRSFPYEDLSQYIIRPLDLEASSRGYKETVCHKKFCCEFYIKTGLTGSKASALNYGLAAFDGTRCFGQKQYIGAQSCAVFACAGLYKRSCGIGSTNDTADVIFEEVAISANFTKHHSIQYPVIISTNSVKSEQFSFDTKIIPKSRQSNSKLFNSEFLTFGVFGRDFSKDYESRAIVNTTNNMETDYLFNFIYNDDFQEIIDYLWIRLRIFIFVVSIYILEMM